MQTEAEEMVDLISSGKQEEAAVRLQNSYTVVARLQRAVNQCNRRLTAMTDRFVG